MVKFGTLNLMATNGEVIDMITQELIESNAKGWYWVIDTSNQCFMRYVSDGFSYYTDHDYNVHGHNAPLLSLSSDIYKNWKWVKVEKPNVS